MVGCGLVAASSTVTLHLNFFSTKQTWANNASVADLIQSDRFQPRRRRTCQLSQRLHNNSTIDLLNFSAAQQR